MDARLGYPISGCTPRPAARSNQRRSAKHRRALHDHLLGRTGRQCPLGLRNVVRIDIPPDIRLDDRARGQIGRELRLLDRELISDMPPVISIFVTVGAPMATAVSLGLW
jgi:hypothetical protein